MVEVPSLLSFLLDECRRSLYPDDVAPLPGAVARMDAGAFVAWADKWLAEHRSVEVGYLGDTISLRLDVPDKTLVTLAPTTLTSSLTGDTLSAGAVSITTGISSRR